MPVVTITSDFGLTDYYLPVIKGAMLSKNDQLTIVDITHNIKHFDIVQAAFILKNAFVSFPKGSIHLLSVNNSYDKKRCFLALKYKGHYFIGPDNGVFSLMFPDNINTVYELTYKTEGAFPLKEIFASAVAHIANGLPLNEIGIPLDAIAQRINFHPVTTKNKIQGTIIHIDHYGNAISNIHRELFYKIQKKRNFLLYYKRNNPLKKLTTNYFDVAIGEPLCFFNSANYLEIAINMGKANTMLGLNEEDTIQIDFID